MSVDEDAEMSDEDEHGADLELSDASRDLMDAIRNLYRPHKGATSRLPGVTATGYMKTRCFVTSNPVVNDVYLSTAPRLSLPGLMLDVTQYIVIGKRASPSLSCRMNARGAVQSAPVCALIVG